jgi:hypothetical protein
MNKIESVRLMGGILGLFLSSPRKDIEGKIKSLNSEGYKVVQVIPDDGGNLITFILKFLLLVITLGLYTLSGGYLVIAEKI